jgi:hypothetical protein
MRLSNQNITDRAETLQIYWVGRFVNAGTPDVLPHPFPRLTSLTLCLEIGGLGNSTPAAVPDMILGGELLQLRCLSLSFYISKFLVPSQISKPSINGFLNLLESTPSLEFFFCTRHDHGLPKETFYRRRISFPSLRLVQFPTQSLNERYNVTILECLTTRQLTVDSLFGSM